MSDLFELAKLTMILGFLLMMALLGVLAMPKSPLRDHLMPWIKFGFAMMCGLYVISPLDLAPEMVFGPFGLIDDAGAVIAGYKAVRSAMAKPEETANA